MWSPRIRYANDAGGAAIQDRIRSLTEQIKARPDNELPLLELAHLYAQVWIQTQRPDALQRVLACLERALGLEKGQYAAQLAKLLDGVARRVREQGLAEPLAKLEEMAHRLASLTAEPAPTAPSPPPPVSAPAPPASAPAPQPAPAADLTPDPPVAPAPPSTPSRPIGETPLPPSEPPETGPEEAVENDSALDAVPSARDDSLLDSPPPIFRYPGLPSGPGRGAPGDFDVEVHTAEEEAAPHDRRQFARAMATLGASTLREVQQLFEEGRLNDILRAYTALSDIRTKRRIIEGLIARLSEWRIEPVLAVAALETDEQIFRFIMRTLLRGDRSEICKQINLPAYSPDLQKVAVIVLSELGVRSALAKLADALRFNDPIVRTVAAHGIARAGKAAISYVPKLIETVCSDPNIEVRRSAAKALTAMNLKEAYLALEEEGKKTRFDAEIYAELETMRERFGGPRRPRESEKAKTEKRTPVDKAKEKAKKDKAKLLIVVVIVVLLFVAWQQIKSKLPSESPDAQTEGAGPAHQQPTEPMPTFD